MQTVAGFKSRRHWVPYLVTPRGCLTPPYPVAPSIEPHFQERALRAHGVSSSRFDDETAHGGFAAQSGRRSSTLQCLFMTQSGHDTQLADS